MKFIKIKNKKLLEQYGRSNLICEYCKEQYSMEVHHIFKNHFRTDELWNIIALCHNCHTRCHAEKGLKKRQDIAINVNELLKIKILKQEISKETLIYISDKQLKQTIVNKKMLFSLYKKD